MGLEEFQRQQKELKDQDRQKKMAAATGLNQYKGGEHDIKHTKALTDIRAQNRLRKVSAVRNQHGYKEYRSSSQSPEKKKHEQVKEEVVADVSLYSNEDDAEDDKKIEGLPEPEFTADRIGETDAVIEATKNEVVEKEDVLDVKKVEEEKTAADESARLEEEAAAIVAVKYAAKREAKEKEAAEETQAADEEAARIEAKKAMKEEADMLEAEAKEIAEAEKQAAMKDVAEAAWKVKLAEDLVRAKEEEVNRLAAAATDAKQKQEIDELADEWSNTALDNDAPSETDQAVKDASGDGCQIDLDFTFGLFYSSKEPPPEWDVCTQAASSIVPNKIHSGKIPVSYDPKFPPVVKTIKKDDAFVPKNGGQIGLYRYIVRGIVPVYLNETIEDKSERAPVRRDLLKKQSSFVPIRRMDSPREIVVENEQGDQWKRVRKGKPVTWQEIVETNAYIRGVKNKSIGV